MAELTRYITEQSELGLSTRFEESTTQSLITQVPNVTLVTSSPTVIESSLTSSSSKNYSTSTSSTPLLAWWLRTTSKPSKMTRHTVRSTRYVSTTKPTTPIRQYKNTVSCYNCSTLIPKILSIMTLTSTIKPFTNKGDEEEITQSSTNSGYDLLSSSFENTATKLFHVPTWNNESVKMNDSSSDHALMLGLVLGLLVGKIYKKIG